MRLAIIYISYHPGSLVDYECLKKRAGSDFISVLIMCRHSYVSQDIIEMYSGKFDYFILLPDVNYRVNIIRGFLEFSKYMKEFKRGVNKILESIDAFQIVSDYSAYLPVNYILSFLTRQEKCDQLISTRDYYSFDIKIDRKKQMCVWIYTFSFGLYPVKATAEGHYFYIKDFFDTVVKFESRFIKKQKIGEINKGRKPIYRIFRSEIEQVVGEKDTIIVFTASNLRRLGCSLSQLEYEACLAKFISALADYYKGSKILCKPHPTELGQIMQGFEGIKYEIYDKRITSEMFIEQNATRIKACYTHMSTSVLYPSKQGIPSYTFYKYLKLENKYLTEWFETEEAQQNPFLYNITTIDEIGCIDSVNIKDIKTTEKDEFDNLMTYLMHNEKQD